MHLTRHRAKLLAAMLTLPLIAGASEDARLREARAVAAAMPPKLLAELQAQIAAGGVASAVAVCRERAPQIAREMSAETGWRIRRVSSRNRNPAALPDAWEAAALEEFDRRVAAGADPSKLEHAGIVDGSYRYMKALPTQPLCLACHGGSDEIPPDVKKQLSELYPEDKATGYAVGQVRGAISISRALD